MARGWLGAAGIVAGGIVLLVMPLSEAYRPLWLQGVLDWGHVPLFAAMTLALWRWSRLRGWGVVLAMAAVAALAELAQGWTGRTVEVADLLRSLAGIALVALWTMGSRGRWTPARLAASIGLLAATFVGIAPAWWDAAIAWYEFPLVGSFTAPGSLRS